MALINTLNTAANCMCAIEETITTPTPGLGHGRIADCCAALTLVAGFFGLI